MAIYKLTRKTFSEELKKMYELKKAGKLQGSLAENVAKRKAKNAAAEAQKVAARAARKDVGNVFQKEVGLKQGMMNTWNNAGKMGKAGMVGAGVAGTALLAKGLFGGKKQQQAAN